MTIDGNAAPLLYVSATQINAVAPLELTAGSTVSMQVTENSTALPDFRAQVDVAAPQVFLNSQGSAAALNQDGSVNSQTNPAQAGSYVSIWATGTGYAPGNDGQAAAGADEFCTPGLILCGVAQSDGTPVNVSYTGAAPGTVAGVMQINFQVTAGQGYYLSVDGIDSNSFTVYTTP